MKNQADIILRSGTPAYSVATRLRDELGFAWRRDAGRHLFLERRAFTDPSITVGIGMADYRWEMDGLDLGYDILIWVNVRGVRGEREDAEAEALFAEMCHCLGYPAVLSDEGTPLLAWSPEQGARRFPPGTSGTERDRDLWADYAYPQVPAEVRIADGDVLGQLYARILADPDSDDLRLAYADAVADELPDYAELIRLQVEYTVLRRAGDPIDQDRWQRMRQLERAVQGDIAPRNGTPLPRPGQMGENRQVKRGFIELVAVDADFFFRNADRMIAGIPLRGVYLSGITEENVGRLAAIPQLSRLRGLALWGCPIGDAGLRTFLSSPYLTRLRWLNLEKTGITVAGVEALAASEALPELGYVTLDRDLNVNPELHFDWADTFADLSESHLGQQLARRYDRAWLRWRPKYYDSLGWDPRFDEV
ncbi:hypothetical protein Lfu02_14170 [Longispora fulva]|uniref:Uncharacterized protein (TIGR02996 family) n=1 Tax=Longispora fulva TaxID=619741 RepID=A0A8J7GP01_9ACTN|nr:TIGR02996 domain-containing protein [Longispora fulva]MBG6140573.1 uncharacterized protein (TIGR02996 family) [Longispora fulva]GIG57045.1 hypothetical protein Lfu02_14170 [Longispora fulva]